MKKFFTFFFFFLALIGLVIGLIVHIMSILNHNVQNKFPHIWILHLGVLLIFFVALLLNRKNYKQKTILFSKQKNPFKALKMLGNAPNWMVTIVIGILLYCITNFFIVQIKIIAIQHGSATYEDGKYAVRSRGKVVKYIHAETYNAYCANELRGVSGHWVMFYALGTMMLFPFQLKKKEETKDLNDVLPPIG